MVRDVVIVMQSEWLRCLDCGWEWDDMGGGYICDCFDRLGRRRSERILTWPTINGRTTTPPSMTIARLYAGSSGESD